MSAHGSIEAVHILANAFDRLISRLEYSAPDQLSLVGCTSCFQHCIIVAVSLAAHGGNDVVRLEDFSIFITATLAFPVCVQYQSWRGLPDRNGFIQGTDGKRLFHPVPRVPAGTPARRQIDTDGQI